MAESVRQLRSSPLDRPALPRTTSWQSIRGGKRKSFNFKELGKLAVLGHRSAVAQVFGVNVSGFLAWFLWRTIYLMKLPGWGRRMKVAASWTFDLFLPAELVQLKLGDSIGVSHEHFEPGQEVFHQDDLGDRIYIIARGEAEVSARKTAVRFCSLSSEQENISARWRYFITRLATLPSVVLNHSTF